MEFAVKIKVYQSDDALTLTIVDESIYGNNTDNINSRADVLTRTLEIKGSDGVVKDTIPMDLIDTDGNYYATFPITKDIYLANKATFTFVSIEPKVGLENFLSTRFYKNKYVDYMSSVCSNDCGCQKPKTCNELTWAERYFNSSVGLAARLEGIKADEDITAANSLIDSLSSNCNC